MRIAREPWLTANTCSAGYIPPHEGEALRLL